MLYLKRIKDLREDRDIKQITIAKLLNVTQTTYSKYERNECKLTIEQLILICEFYNISPEYILGFTDKIKMLPKD